MSYLNFLYCFDKNYNIQGYLAINSLLNNVNEKINIFIIHENQITFKKFKQKLEVNKNLNKIEIYDFNNENIDFIFPNVIGSHVSNATYYRIFASDYLPKNLNYYIYLDSDIFCIHNPVNEFKFFLEKLESTNYIIGATKEFDRLEPNIHHFERLSLKGKMYFNAGMLIVNHQEWMKLNVKIKLLDLLITLNNKLVFWDQDLLNVYFDNSFLSVTKHLNYNLFLTEKNYFSKFETSQDVKLVHYAGSYKPWSVRGAAHARSKIYQYMFKKEFNKRFHIVSKWRFSNLIELLKIVFSKKIIKIDNPLIYIKQALFSIIFKQ